MNNETIKINANVSIDNAINCLKKGDTDLATKFLLNAKEILELIEPESDGELNNFAQSEDLEADVDQFMIQQYAHEREQFSC